MTTVRRLYFYGLVIISIEVVIWGIVGLLRTVVSGEMIGAGSLLASGLSLVLVGVPIFWLHWRTVQRDAAHDPSERACRTRAVFFYAILFALIGPILYAIIAIINRGLAGLFGLTQSDAWFGGGQTVLDNLIAVFVNVIAAVYFWQVLQQDWKMDVAENYLAESRRLYRYIWVLAGLSILISGIYNILRYVLDTPGQNLQQTAPVLAGGISLLLIGAPLWGLHWWVIQESLADAAERRSLLRLVVLYLISLAAVIGVLTTVGAVVSSLLHWLLGSPTIFVAFIQSNSSDLGAAIPLGVFWAYYGRILTREVAALQDQPLRFALHRLYFYILSFLGLGVALVGLYNLIEYLARLIFLQNQVSPGINPPSSALAALLVGVPLWLVTWSDMQTEAARTGDRGDHARRSVLRKIYLYLALFLFVVGAMAFSGQFIFTLLNALLSGLVPVDFGEQLVKLVLWLAVDVTLLLYHLRTLRKDGQIAQQTLGNMHAAFPTLIMSEEGDPIHDVFIQEIRRLAPRLPVALQLIDQGVPDESLLRAKAVILPMGLAIDPSEPLRLWLAEYQGMRLILPQDRPGYTWLGQSGKKPSELAHEAARAIRQMAEGETLRQGLPSNPWSIAGYIGGGLFGLLALILLFLMMISSLFR